MFRVLNRAGTRKAEVSMAAQLSLRYKRIMTQPGYSVPLLSSRMQLRTRQRTATSFLSSLFETPAPMHDVCNTRQFRAQQTLLQFGAKQRWLSI